MSSNKSQAVPTPESIHDAWLSQRAELERDLFDGWTPEVNALKSTTSSNVPEVATTTPEREVDRKAVTSNDAAPESAVKTIVTATARHPLPPRTSNDAPGQQRTDQPHLVTEALSQQRESFLQDLAKQRAAFQRDLSARETEWTTQRDQEWAALRSAKEVQDVAQQRLQDDLSLQRVREREEMMQWRRQAEAELAEARRLLEQERLQEHQNFARHCETEMSRLRREREELDTRVRHVQSELAYARQRQEDELRQACDTQSAQMRAERAELDKLRTSWLDKFRREQIVLENGMQFFGQHLSRVSEELRVAQRGLQAVSESATEAQPSLIFAEPRSAEVDLGSMEPTILSLDEIRQRLNALRQPQRVVA